MPKLTWHTAAIAVAVGLVFIVVDIKTKRKISGLIAAIPVVGPFLGT